LKSLCGVVVGHQESTGPCVASETQAGAEKNGKRERGRKREKKKKKEEKKRNTVTSSIDSPQLVFIITGSGGSNLPTVSNVSFI
jgi:cell division GTPase FtsZ